MGQILEKFPRVSEVIVVLPGEGLCHRDHMSLGTGMNYSLSPRPGGRRYGFGVSGPCFGDSELLTNPFLSSDTVRTL